MGLVVGFMVAGCGAATFGFHYYGLKMAKYDGTLTGPTPADDKDLSTCQGNKCVCMYSSAFFPLKQDYLDCKQSLADCQRGR